MYKAILFDLDNTLIDRDRAFRHYARASLPPLSAQQINRLIQLDQGGYGDNLPLFAFWHSLGGQSLNRESFGQGIAMYIQPCGLLNVALSQLEPIIGIITNGGLNTQLQKWQNSALDAVIDRKHVWISQELGVAKPAPDIFHIACAAMNVSPLDVLFVGDNPQVDIAGARAVGMDTLWIRKPITASQINDIRAEYEYKRLSPN